MSDPLQDCLKTHNDYRAQHGAASLTLNDALTSMAQKHAQSMADKGKLFHSEHGDRTHEGKPTGENCAYSWSQPAKPVDGCFPVNSWYSEVKDYDFSNPGFNCNTGHFTQVVWKESRELGFGYAQSSNGAWYYCCNYYPAGNMQGNFPQNVSPKQ